MEVADQGSIVELHDDEGAFVLEEVTRNDLASGLGEKLPLLLRLQIYFRL